MLIEKEKKVKRREKRKRKGGEWETLYLTVRAQSARLSQSHKCSNSACHLFTELRPDLE
jgi:hypothetical protein